MKNKLILSAPLETAAVTNVLTQNLAEGSAASAAVTQFMAAYEGLRRRKQELDLELAQIQAAFERMPAGAVPADETPVPVPVVEAPPAASRTRGLTKAVVTLLAERPLTKPELLERLQAQGFELGHNPFLKLDPILYNKNKVSRHGKVFGLAAGQG